MDLAQYAWSGERRQLSDEIHTKSASTPLTHQPAPDESYLQIRKDRGKKKKRKKLQVKVIFVFDVCG